MTSVIYRDILGKLEAVWLGDNHLSTPEDYFQLFREQLDRRHLMTQLKTISRRKDYLTEWVK